MLLSYLTIKLQCKLSADRKQTSTGGLRGVSGSFTYFTTCIEGGAGRVNDSVALHDGNVGLDNLQLRTTAMTNNRQNNMVVKKNIVSGQDQVDATK